MSINIEEFDNLGEEWFTIDEIEETDSTDKLYCISVDSEEKQFLIGEMGVPTHNTDEAKEADELKGEAVMIIGSIARLGRASGVHLAIATQRPDAKNAILTPNKRWLSHFQKFPLVQAA